MCAVLALALAAAAVLVSASADILPDIGIGIRLQDPWMTSEWQQLGLGPSDLVWLGGVVMMAISFARQAGRHPTKKDRATLKHLVEELGLQDSVLLGYSSGVESIILDVVASQSLAQNCDDDLAAAVHAAASNSRVFCEALKKHGLPDDSADAIVRKLAQLSRDVEGTDAHREARVAQRMLEKYPDRVPVLCSKVKNSRTPSLAKCKFLVPGSMLVGEFKYILHKQRTDAGWSDDRTLYIFDHKRSSIKSAALMSEVYEAGKAEDGFLHITYGAEDTFGYAPNNHDNWLQGIRVSPSVRSRPLVQR